MASNTSLVLSPVLALIRGASSHGIPSTFSISVFISSGLAAGKSILLITGTISKLLSRAKYTLAIVWACIPWAASTTKRAPSQAAKDLLTS